MSPEDRVTKSMELQEDITKKSGNTHLSLVNTPNTRLSLVNTLQALWVRLENRPAYSLGLSERAKQFIWACVVSLGDVGLYELEVARQVELEGGKTISDIERIWNFCICMEVVYSSLYPANTGKNNFGVETSLH